MCFLSLLYYILAPSFSHHLRSSPAPVSDCDRLHFHSANMATYPPGHPSYVSPLPPPSPTGTQPVEFYDGMFDAPEPAAEEDLMITLPTSNKRVKAPKPAKMTRRKMTGTHRWQEHVKEFKLANVEGCAGKSAAVVSKMAAASYIKKEKCSMCGK